MICGCLGQVYFLMEHQIYKTRKYKKKILYTFSNLSRRCFNAYLVNLLYQIRVWFVFVYQKLFELMIKPGFWYKKIFLKSVFVFQIHKGYSIVKNSKVLKLFGIQAHVKVLVRLWKRLQKSSKRAPKKALKKAQKSSKSSN